MNTPNYNIPPQVRQRQERIQESIDKMNERVWFIVFKYPKNV